MAFIWDMVMLVGVVGIGYWIMQNPEALQGIIGELKLPGGGGGGGAASGGGGSANLGAGAGGLLFKGTGKTWKAVDSGKTTRNYASGGSSGTTQWDIKDVGTVTNLEVTCFVNVGSCADEVSLKVFGPSHSGSNCCWLIMNVECESGKFQLGGEGPHPNTDKTNQATGKSMGSIAGKEVGIKMVVYKTGSGYHCSGYAFQGNTWVEMLTKDFAQWGADKMTSTPHASSTVQFRTDCSGVKYSRAEAAEIIPGTASAGGGAAAPAAGGGASATPAAGAAADAEGGEDDKENENEDEDDNENSNYAMVYYAGRPYYFNPRVHEMNPYTPMHRARSPPRRSRFTLS